MKAKLFVNSNSFKYTENTTVDSFSYNIAVFTELLNYIGKFDDDIYIDEKSFYETEIFPDKSLSDLLFKDRQEYDCKDTLDLLLTLITKITQIPSDMRPLPELIKDKNVCSALLVLDKHSDIDIENEKQVLATKQDWIEFHRNCLISIRLDDPEEFLKESECYFEKLIIHPDNKFTLSKIYKTHLKRLVEYLSIMNDCLLNEYKESRDTSDDFVSFLKSFASSHSKKIDGASFEGSFKNDFKKEKFYKDFCINGSSKKILCEPHLKMDKDDKGKRRPGRIYFKALKAEDSFVYIGIITDHIHK